MPAVTGPAVMAPAVIGPAVIGPAVIGSVTALLVKFVCGEKDGHHRRAIRHVGPELTLAYARARRALERLQRLMRLLTQGLNAAMLAAMHARPADWRAHVAAGPQQKKLMLHGLSDRMGYCWPAPQVQAAQARRIAHPRTARPEPGLLAQDTGGAMARTTHETLPETVINHVVGAVITRCRTATGA